MAVIRQQQWLGQMRVDSPHLKTIDSAICNDFDILAGKMLVGQTPQILNAFNIPVTNTIGAPAQNLQLTVAGGLLMHFGASESRYYF